MNYLTDTKKERYHLLNPHKYFGTKDPVCKSGWEKQIFVFMDTCKFVLKWGYECMEVPYFNPAKGTNTIYFPDIFCHILQADGSQKQFLLEIKPYKMANPPKPPKPPKKPTGNALKKYENAIRRYNNDFVAYKVNEAKWNQARAWCQRHKIEFLIVHEKNYNFLKV